MMIWSEVEKLREKAVETRKSAYEANKRFMEAYSEYLKERGVAV